mgnify:CR=1 FL=1
MKIAISGKMGSGKTTLANVLITQYGFVGLSFAKALKEVAMTEYGLSHEEAFGNKKNRELLQQIGEDKRNEHGQNYWVDKVLEQLNQNPNANYVVDDVRYHSEYKALKDNGFIMVRIDSRMELRQERLGDRFKNPDHISETQLDTIVRPDFAEEGQDSWDVYIINNSSIDTFESFAESIYKAFSDDPEIPTKQDNV